LFLLFFSGFLNANGSPNTRARVANYGLMDQIAVLHWVQQNIALFGGDPENVSLMGHGPGAACINFLMISPTVVPGTKIIKYSYYYVYYCDGKPHSGYISNYPLRWYKPHRILLPVE